MKRLEELLEKREAEIKAEEEAREIADDKRRNHNVGTVVSSLFICGGGGLFIGAFLGYCKGCQSYGAHPFTWVDGHDPLMEPFRYIPEKALPGLVIGAWIGIFLAFIRWQKRKW